MTADANGEWSKPRMVLTQFQNIEPNDVAQFKSGAKQPILWPPEYKTGEMIYPYEAARKITFAGAHFRTDIGGAKITTRAAG